MKKELDKDSYMYRKLKRMYPSIDTFFYEQEDGSYLNKAQTEYYNDKKELIYTEIHDWYG